MKPNILFTLLLLLISRSDHISVGTDAAEMKWKHTVALM